MTKINIRKSIYALCASLGFLSAVFTTTAASGDGVILHSALEALHAPKIEKEVVSATKFSDIDENMWYFPYVDKLFKDGVVNGISETEYSPSGTFTAAECCAVITRYLGLEEYAKEAQKKLIEASVKGNELWYCGYVQTLYDAGIIKKGEMSLSEKDGCVVITDASVFSSPLKRHTFASFITRSFDIKTDVVSAKNYPAEIVNNGNNFITGGRYDDSVNEYANDINDFWSIPDETRIDVLKAYYNGIFNGDEAGNFNPEALLTRAEMSKVIAVVTDAELRTRKEYRNIPEVFDINDEKYIVDGWKNKVLDRNYSCELLMEAAKGISCDVKSGGVDVGYVPSGAPEGYVFDVRFYSANGGVYNEAAKAPVSQGEVMIVKGLASPRVVMMLRDCETAEVEGALRLDISSNGTVTFDNLFKPVL